MRCRSRRARGIGSIHPRTVPHLRATIGPEKTVFCVARLNLNHAIPKLHYNPLCINLGAAHTHHRIGGNFEAFLGNGLFAATAEAVAVLGDALEGVGDTLELLFLTAAQFEGHLLVLHRVHPREAADGGVELHHAGGILAGDEVTLDFFFQREQAFAEMSLAFGGQFFDTDFTDLHRWF